MLHNKKISLILPCRNEGSHIHEVLKRVPKDVDEILIVSNKSTDDTLEVATRLSRKDKRIVPLEDNRTIKGIGYGYAHITGITKATGDIIYAADGDATYPIEDAEKIIDFMLKNRYDFISCNRYPLQHGVKIPFKLQLGVNILNWEILILYGIPIKDALSGMWFFTKDIRDELKLDMGDWNLSPQIKINAMRNKGIRSSEYSIAQAQRLGTTKQNYFKTGLNHAIWILTNRIKSR